MRIHLVLCLLGLFLTVSCGSKSHYPEGGTNADRMGMSVYENEFYSVRYPAHWTVKADIRDKYEGYEKFAGSDKITLRKHKVDLVNTYRWCQFPYCKVKFSDRHECRKVCGSFHFNQRLSRRWEISGYNRP